MTKKEIIAIILSFVIILSTCGIFVFGSIAKDVPDEPKLVYASTLINHFGNMGYTEIDEVDCIDRYDEGKWYAYYVCCGGDNWVITIKDNAVDVCVQLN